MKNFPGELRHGSGAVMVLDPTRLLLAFKKMPSREELGVTLGQVGLQLEDANDRPQEALPRRFQVVNHTSDRLWVRTRDGSPIDQARFDAVEKALEPWLDWIGPVYSLDPTIGRGGLVSPVPNVLLIRVPGQQGKALDATTSERLRQYGLQEVPEKSKYLGDYRYYVLPNIKDRAAYQVQELLLGQENKVISEARFENMPMIVPTTATPNDPLFAQQWDMTQIQAGGAGFTGWDISTGVGTVVVCVLDTGCDLTHPDLQFATPGINLGTMMPDGSPDPANGFVTGHGTCCAGIVAGRFNNAVGSAGVAGTCTIMPLAFHNFTDTEVAAGINYAADNGASVISMSFGEYAPGDGLGPTGWDFTIIDPAITHAFNDRGCVLCAATGNENVNTHNRYPARNPLVIACGASDQVDNRKSPTSPDGEPWGSNFGVDVYAGQTTGVSVVAPGVRIPTSDIQGTGGFNTSPGTAGDFFLTFNGTSSATPHVAGLAALIRSVCPTWTNVQVRDRIEQTADKVGVVAYANVPGFPNGTRNTAMGYGRINVLSALQKPAPVINWPAPPPIVYGTPLPSSVCNATASVPGTFVYSPPCNTCPLNAGVQTLSVTFTPNDACDQTVNATVQITVQKATPTITWPPPADIDAGDPLPISAFPTLPTAMVCGVNVTVAGSYTFAPMPGQTLPPGTHTLTAFFMPTDTLNYNPVTATAQIHVLTGHPIILSCSFAPTTLQREERTQVTAIVKNDSIRPHVTQGPDPGFEYSEGDTFQTKGFPSIPGAFRLAVDTDLVPYPYKVHYLYRWGFGHDLAPGESVAVNGFIRFHNSRENGPYFAAMIQETNQVVLDHQCPTLITVERP